MRSVFVAMALAMFSLVLLGADSPFSGTWKLNLAKSKLPRPLPQSVTAVVVVDDTTLKGIQEGIDENGKPFKISVEAKLDGSDCPIVGDVESDTVAVQRINARTLKSKWKKDGRVVKTATQVVSADGKLVTVEVSKTAPDGKKTKGTAVYDRQ
jgi:hypothetical protein